MLDPTGVRLFTDALRQHERARQTPRDLLQDLHVLVVDDHEDTLTVLTTVIGDFGARVFKSASARRALEIVRTIRVNVVVSDLMLPGEDGFWLIDQIRRLRPERGGTVPVVAVTAHRYLYDPTHISEKGFEAYLTKPIDPFDLVRTVARLVGR